MSQFLKLFLVTVSVALFLISDVSASDIDNDVLVESMVDNGLLTPDEAEKIIEGSKRKKFREESQSETASQSWTKNIDLTGDLTVRYDQQKTKSTATPVTRFRGRFRYRLGVIAKLNDKVQVGAGLASGDGDPRSSFRTFGNSSEKGDVNLDYAYGQWAPASWASMVVGKFPRESYLWTPTDMMWDSDIRPEGGAVHLETPIATPIKGFVNAGVSVLDEISSNDSDPTMYYVQPGIRFDNEHFDFKFAAIRYAFNAVQNVRLDHSACSNRGLTPIGDSCTGALVTEYDSAGGSVEAGYKMDIFGRDKRIGIFGEYIKNLTTDENKIGWAGGVRLGDQHIAMLGDWQASYQYTYLQREAVLDILPNSDRYDGQTNVTGIKTGLDIGLWKDIKIGVNYYHDDKITGTKAPRSFLLTDVTYKF